LIVDVGQLREFVHRCLILFVVKMETWASGSLQVFFFVDDAIRCQTKAVISESLSRDRFRNFAELLRNPEVGVDRIRGSWNLGRVLWVMVM
jgi:hypothetical protein